MGKVFGGGGSDDETFELSSDEIMKFENELSEGFIAPGRVFEFAEELKDEPWAFQDKKEGKKNFGNALEYFMRKYWPCFDEKMAGMASFIFENKNDLKQVSDVLLYFIGHHRQELFICWALSMNVMRDKSPEEIEQFLKIFKTLPDIEIVAPYHEGNEHHTEFPHWLFDDWMFPNLKYFHYVAQESRKNDDSSSGKEDDQNSKDDNENDPAP